MPVVFVHGVPDTPRVGNAVVVRLDRMDVLTLPRPGFGCAVPDGLSATKEACVNWEEEEEQDSGDDEDDEVGDDPGEDPCRRGAPSIR